MKDIMKKIERAYNYLNKISVRGDFVEIMALARQELREAYAMMEAKEKEQEKKEET